MDDAGGLRSSIEFRDIWSYTLLAESPKMHPVAISVLRLERVLTKCGGAAHSACSMYEAPVKPGICSTRPFEHCLRPAQAPKPKRRWHFVKFLNFFDHGENLNK